MPRHKLCEGGSRLQYDTAARAALQSNVWDEGHCISFCRVMSQNGHQTELVSGQVKHFVFVFDK